jgi:hypothetical protein
MDHSAVPAGEEREREQNTLFSFSIFKIFEIFSRTGAEHLVSDAI